MFTKSQTAAKLDAEIHSALDQLRMLEKTSEEYGTLVEHITRLHKLTSEEAQTQVKIEEIEMAAKPEPRLKPPSMDTVLVVAANLYGILRITRYEREEVINTKSLGFIMKPR